MFMVHLPATHSFPPQEELGCKVEDLDATEDGEAGEEAHRAPDETKLGHQGHLDLLTKRMIGLDYLHISFHSIKGWRVEVDVDHLEL